MGYLVSPPTLEVVAARPQSGLVAAPMRPLPRLAHPNETSGTNPLLGPGPTALAQTLCRKVAAISTTKGVERKEKNSQSLQQNWWRVYIHGRFRENSWFGGIAQGWT